MRIYQEEYLRWLQQNKSVVNIDKEEGNIDTVEGFYEGQWILADRYPLKNTQIGQWTY